MKLADGFPGADRRSDSCATHGEFESFRVGDRWTGCEPCSKAIQAERKAEQDRETRKQSVFAKLQQANIPEPYKSAKVDSSVETWLVKAMANEAAGPLVLVGTVGTGKTYQASAALKRWILRTEQGGYYIPAADYAVHMRSTWNNRAAESEAEVLNRYARTPFLALDDVGAGRDIDMQIVQGLIDARYRAGLMGKLIVVSNFSVDNFNTAFGERAADRIREGCTLVEMVGESRRRPAA